MATFQEFLRVTRVSLSDKTSGKRMREILRIMRKYKVMKGLTPENAVQMLEALGPTYVKIGQLASSRSDMLPKEYCDAFAQLQDDVTPMSFETVLQCIDEAYGYSWKEVFLAIDPKPLGAASIAQVHKAVLLNGEPVAVKVRRPGIVEQMAEDITLMKRALATAEFVASAHQNIWMNLDNFVEVLEKTTNNETNFTIELGNLLRFHKECENWPGITCPKAYPHASNDAVLVMEYVQGTEINKVQKLREEGYNINELANRLIQNYISQVLDVGFFHADPHPGNIIVRGDDIVWIDLGMTGTLSASERQQVGRMLRSIVTGNSYDLMQAVLSISKRHGQIDYGSLLSQLASLLGKYSAADLQDINIGTVMGEMVEVMRGQNLIMMPAVTMLVRGVVTIEGLLDNIAPNTNVLDVVSEHVLQQSLDPEHIKKRAIDISTSALESTEALTKLPHQISDTLEMLDRGELRVKGDIVVAEDALATIYASVGRASLALISMGLFIGSSILCTTNMEPKFLEVPILGVLGYIGAFILGVYVIFVTLKSRHRMKNNLKAD